MLRASVLATVAVLIAGTFSSANAQEEEITEYHEGHVRQKVTINPDGTVTASPPEGEIRVSNSVGEHISTRPLEFDEAGDRPAPGSFTCVNNRNRRRLEIFEPHRITANDPNKLVIGFIWHPYKYNRARQVTAPDGDRYPTKQYLVCATGGVDGQEGWRILMSGPGSAWDNSRRSKRIGTKWGTGETGPTTKVSLGFVVGRGPVSINGSIEQEIRAVLRGNHAGPYRSDFEAYAINGVAGWWDADCGPCTRLQGSPDFQGNVASGLWEFRQHRRRGFAYWTAPFFRYYCSNPFGCG